MASESILNSVKQIVGLTPDNPEFDLDITLLINSAFATLNQIGLGPVQGFVISNSSTTWDDFTKGDLRLSSVQQYVSYKVRLAFDPPSTGPLITAMQTAVQEIETRLSILREYINAGIPEEENGGGTTPEGPDVADGGGVEDNGLLDGGTPTTVFTGNDYYDGGSP